MMILAISQENTNSTLIIGELQKADFKYQPIKVMIS